MTGRSCQLTSLPSDEARTMCSELLRVVLPGWQNTYNLHFGTAATAEVNSAFQGLG